MSLFTDDVTARVHDERVRCQGRLDVLEEEQPLFATRNQPRRGCVQDVERGVNLRRQRGDAGQACLVPGPNERRARGLRFQAPHRDSRDDQLVRRSRRVREWRRIEIRQRPLGLVDASDEDEPPDFEVSRVRRVDAVPVRFERCPRRIERLHRPAQIACGERHLGFGDDAPGAGHGLFRAERARRAAQEQLGSHEIAELRHRGAAQRQRRRVVAQRDPLQRAEGIAGGERARRGGDQRVHRNPVTLVTPTLPVPGAKSIP